MSYDLPAGGISASHRPANDFLYRCVAARPSGEPYVRCVPAYRRRYVDRPRLRERRMRRCVRDLHRQVRPVVADLHIKHIRRVQIHARTRHVYRWSRRRYPVYIQPRGIGPLSIVAVQVKLHCKAVRQSTGSSNGVGPVTQPSSPWP